MRQGKVKWYNGKKCFGFISPDTEKNGSKEDVFVHASSLRDADIRFLNENDVVEFDDEVGNNGKLSVTTIKLISRDEESAKKFQERRNQFRGGERREGGFRGGERRDNRSGGFRGGERRGGERREDRDGEKRGFLFWKK